jgi:hypothetical protein
MTTTLTHHHAVAAVCRPGIGRRISLAVTGLLALALPVVWTVNISRMLLTGVEPAHRFHQATGQGLLLLAVWLSALLPLLRAGWRGRRPPATAGLMHVAFVVVGAACAVAAPGGGAPWLVGVIAVTGALLWLALPVRPRLRRPVRIDPVLAPAALAVTGWLSSYAVGQVALQNDAVGYHAQNPHFFDMAWLVLVLSVLGLAGASLAGARRLLVWPAVGCVWIGAAGIAFGEPVTWSLVTLGAGLAVGGALLLRRRLGGDA